MPDEVKKPKRQREGCKAYVCCKECLVRRFATTDHKRENVHRVNGFYLCENHYQIRKARMAGLKPTQLN